jgi:hypothetical protein
MTKYYISPTNDHRAEIWERIYGRSELPVKYAQPHMACTQRWGDVDVYYLDTTAVPEALLDRLATLEARRSGISYEEARMLVRREWLIKADGTKVELRQPAATADGNDPWQMAFPFLPNVRLQGNGRYSRIPRNKLH